MNCSSSVYNMPSANEMAPTAFFICSHDGEWKGVRIQPPIGLKRLGSPASEQRRNYFPISGA
jgi:hypothetical protein